MKKIIVSILLILCVSLPVSAIESEEKYLSQIDEMISEYNIDFENLKEYPFETLWNSAVKSFKEYFRLPIKSLVTTMSVLLISAFVNLLHPDKDNQITTIINLVVTILLFYIVFEGMNEISGNVSNVLFDVKNFMLTFVPVFAGLSFASGEFVTSTIYSGFFLASIAAVANFCVNYVIPSINLYLTVGIVSNLTTVINLKPLCKVYSRIIKTAMVSSVSVICFLLSLQTSIAQGKDNLMLKAGKMVVTSTVPIIGSSLENAMGSIYASMGVLKGFCGLAGVAVVLSLFMPYIFMLVVNWGGFQLMIIVSAILESNLAVEIFECFKDTTEILLSICVLFMVLLLFSLTIMIKSTGV